MKSKSFTQAGTVVFLFSATLLPTLLPAANGPSKLGRDLSSPPPNFTRVGEVVEGTLSHGRSTRVPLPIETAGCYRIKAAAGEATQDISLIVYQSGVEKARDRLSGKRPSVDWCAAEGGKVEAEVLMFEGEGAFAVAVFLKNPPNASSPKTRKAGGGETDFIANRIRQLAPHFATEKTPVTALLRGNVLYDKEQTFQLKIQGKCITVIAAQSPDLLEIDLRLVGPSGVVRAKLNATPSYTTLSETCPPPGDYNITVRAVRGAGSFGLQVFTE